MAIEKNDSEGTFSPRRTLRRIVVGVSVLVGLGCGVEPETGPLRRAFAQANLSPVAVEVGGITREALSLRAVEGGTIELPLGRVPRGRFRTAVAAMDAVGPGSLSLALEIPPAAWRSNPEPIGRCQLDWPLAEETTDPWQRCDLEIPESLAEATLRIETEGLPGVDFALSDPLLLPADTPARPNIFVLLADTARADRFVSFGGPLPIGEHLEALGEEGIVFEAARAPSSWTRPSTASLLTGLSPSGHRVFARLDSVPETVQTLAELLQQAGYATHAWSTNPNILPLFGFGQGFDVFEDVGSQTWGGRKTDGSALVDRVIATLEDPPGQPGFYYVHFMDPHAPYQPPEEQRAQIEELDGVETTFPADREAYPELEESYRAYLGELLNFDAQLGRFVARLRELDLYENAVIVVTSDHGEEFLDHGASPARRVGAHGHALFEELLHVPMVMKLAGGEPPQRVAARVGLEDVAPSLLAYLGLDAPETVDGQPALIPGKVPADEVRSFVATLRLDGHNQASIVVGDWKLIVYPVTGAERLYDLANDPLEKMNQSGSAPEVADRLRARLEQVLASRERGWHVKACGTNRSEELALVLFDAPEVLPIDLEEHDTVIEQPDSSETWIDLALHPVMKNRTLLGPVTQVFAREQDEFVLIGGDSTGPEMRLARRDGEAISVRIGGEEHFELLEEMDLSDLAERATVSAVKHLNCVPGPQDPPETPFLLLWRVGGAPAAIPEGAVDPATRERLRALGYEW